MSTTSAGVGRSATLSPLIAPPPARASVTEGPFSCLGCPPVTGGPRAARESMAADSLTAPAASVIWPGHRLPGNLQSRGEKEMALAERRVCGCLPMVRHGRALVRRARARKISWIGMVLRECPGDEQSAGRAASRLDEAARAAAVRSLRARFEA